MFIRQVFFIISLLLLSFCGKREKITHAEFKELIEAVYASGHILPRNEYKVFSLADGTIIQKFVSEGENVKAAQPLFRVAAEAQDARLQNARAALQVAQNNYSDQSPILRELKIALENAKIKLTNDSINYFRYKNLFENQASTKMDYDKAILNYQTAQNDFLAKKSNYEKVKNELYLNLQNAQSQYVVNVQEESNFLISSRIAGRVYEVYKEQGEAVRRNDVVALVGDDKAVYIKMSVDELDIPKITTGLQVLVKIDIIKDKVFKAKISKIYPRVNSVDQSFRVEAEFTEEIPSKYSGLSVEANIIIQKKNRTLTIPKSVLVNGDSVMLKRKGKTVKVKVKTGLENMDRVEVISGISEKDEIIEN